MIKMENKNYCYTTLTTTICTRRYVKFIERPSCPICYQSKQTTIFQLKLKVMSTNWIKLTDRAREGIKLINALPYDVFSTVLLYVYRQMDKANIDNGNRNSEGSTSTSSSTSSTSSSRNNANIGDCDLSRFDKENALEELERLVGIPREQFLLLIKTFSYILRRISTFIIKPTQLQNDLSATLNIVDEAKIDAILRLWIRQTTPILNNLANERYESNEIQDVAWKLNVEISSQCQQREKNALAVLQLKTAAGEDINMEMNHDELQQLYNQFEAIQNELDALKLLQNCDSDV